jgi:hypothetical protein
MYDVTARFLDAIRGPHREWGYVQAWYGGALVEFQGESNLPLVDGSIDVDGATPGARRTLSATFAPEPGLWEALAPIGTELKAFTVLRFPDGTTETVPQGVFVVDVQRMGYAVNGDIKVTAPDRWVRVQRARFLAPRASLPGVLVVDQISALLLQAMPAGLTVSQESTATATVPRQTWDRDRDKAIQELAKAASVDVFMDRNGSPVIRNVPTLSSSPVWTVDASASGVLIDADRERNRQRTRNIVVVNSTANPPAFVTQYLWDNDPDSPTYAGSGAGAGTTPPVPASAGPFGQVPHFYASPLLMNASQALQAGGTLLAKTTGLAAQLSLSAVANLALDDGDTIRVELPPERRDLLRPVERHIVDRLSVPLLPHKNAQRLETRSNVADVEES